MKPVKELDPDYLYAGEINVNNRKIAIALNLAGLALLFLFGRLFLQIGAAIRPEIESATLMSVFAHVDLLAAILGLIGVLSLHELVHGFFFWLFTGERPKFGLHILYAYAAAPDWYVPRNRFFVVGLAPFAGITLTGLLLLPFVPFPAVPIMLFCLIFNAAGSVGDLAVGGWLLSQPKDLMVNDTGPSMTFYKVTSPAVASLSRRWLLLTGSLGLEDKKARRTFAGLVGRYTEKWRFYHTLEHVEAVLDTAEELKVLASDYTAVQLAVWFHDVVYDPQAEDNEIRSAEYARRTLVELGLAPEMAKRVSDLILTTISHTAEAGDIDAQILIDADLATLGVGEVRFRSQSEALRQEFSWLSDKEYRQNREQILNSFLERDRIYYTDQLFDTLEDKARRNLAWAVADLP